MKKITLLLLTLFTMSFGYAQTASNYCSTEVFHLDIPAEVNSAINLTIENTSANTMKVTVAAADITFLDLIGAITDAPTKSAADNSVSGEISIILTWAGTPPAADVTIQFIQWRKTSTGGATWQINDATSPFDGICGPPPAPEEDTSLSDLQLDGVTIDGFSSTKISYDIGVLTGDPIPQVTTVTPTNGLATVGTITQGSAVPSSATFDVTSEDTNFVATYTINFIQSGPATPAPTPPARAANDVVSIYSDAYASNISYDNFDAGWCGGAGVTAETISSDNVLRKVTGINCQGIDFSSDRQVLTDFTHIHFDFYTDDTDLAGDVFNFKLVDFAGGGGEASALQVNINGGTTPQLVAGSWVSVDVDITSLGGVVAGSLTRSDIAQIGISTDNLTNVWYDNIYLHKNTTLGIDDNELVSFKVYPNPTQNSWKVKAKSESISSIKVFDILGKSVLSLSPNTNEATIDGTSLKPGLYFAKIESASGISSLKLVKQ